MGLLRKETNMRLLLLLAIFFAALTVSFGVPVPQRGRRPGRGPGRGPPGRRPPRVAGQEDVHQTTTTDSPDPLVEISGLLPLLAPLVSSEDLSPSLQPTLLAVSLEDSLQPLPPSCEPNQPNPAYLYLGLQPVPGT